MNFEIQDCFMDIWKWTSQHLTCNLNFENAFWKSGRTVVRMQREQAPKAQNSIELQVRVRVHA